jgi:hypothetical protein
MRAKLGNIKLDGAAFLIWLGDPFAVGMSAYEHLRILRASRLDSKWHPLHHSSRLRSPCQTAEGGLRSRYVFSGENYSKTTKT